MCFLWGQTGFFMGMGSDLVNVWGMGSDLINVLISSVKHLWRRRNSLLNSYF